MNMQWERALADSDELDYDPSIIDISSDGEYVAVVEGAAVKLTIYEMSESYSSVTAHCAFLEMPELHAEIIGVLWHPVLPRQLLVAFSSGMVHVVTFEPPSRDLETRRRINLKRIMFNRQAVQLTALCLDDEGTEISGIMDGKLFSFGDPFSDEHFHRASLYDKSIPSRLVRFTGHSPLGLCYLERGVVLVVFPLGIFAIKTTYPNEVQWTIDILPSRMLYSGTMSPDKKLFVGVTETGAVEVYNLETQRFVVKIGHSDGPFRDILSAVFYDRNSLALIHKKGPASGRLPNEPCIDVIPRFQAEECNQYTRLSVSCTRTDLGLNNPSTIAIGAGVMDGKGRLIFQRNIFRSVVVVTPEDFLKEDGVRQTVFVSDGHRPYAADIPAPAPSENDSPRTAEAFRILDEYVALPWTMQEFEAALLATEETFEDEQIGEPEADIIDGEIHSDDSNHTPDERIVEVYDENGQASNVDLGPEQQPHRDDALSLLDAYHSHPISLVACGIFVTAILVTVGVQMV